MKDKESLTYSRQGRVYDQHVGVPDAESLLRSLMPYIHNGFFVSRASVEGQQHLTIYIDQLSVYYL